MSSQKVFYELTEGLPRAHRGFPRLPSVSSQRVFRELTEGFLGVPL